MWLSLNNMIRVLKKVIDEAWTTWLEYKIRVQKYDQNAKIW